MANTGVRPQRPFINGCLIPVWCVYTFTAATAVCTIKSFTEGLCAFGRGMAAGRPRHCRGPAFLPAPPGASEYMLTFQPCASQHDTPPAPPNAANLGLFPDF